MNIFALIITASTRELPYLTSSFTFPFSDICMYVPISRDSLHFLLVSTAASIGSFRLWTPHVYDNKTYLTVYNVLRMNA